MRTRSRAGSLVATSQHAGAREHSLFDFPDVRHAIGGNPILFALLAMNLGSAVETEVVDLHDAIFLIPFSMTGGIVTDLEGEPLDVLGAFRNNSLTVGPYIAACRTTRRRSRTCCRAARLGLAREADGTPASVLIRTTRCSAPEPPPWRCAVVDGRWSTSPAGLAGRSITIVVFENFRRPRRYLTSRPTSSNHLSR